MDLISKYNSVITNTGTIPKFHEFIEHLDNEELFKLIELLFTENVNILAAIFQGYKNMDRDEVAFHNLINLPYIL